MQHGDEHEPVQDASNMEIYFFLSTSSKVNDKIQFPSSQLSSELERVLQRTWDSQL